MMYYEDFQVGQRVTTRGRTITEADIVMFASLSGDWFPLHVDAQYASRSPFGERIAHGFLVLSAASGLMPFEEMAIMAFYGMDKVRFVAPTKIGDTIRVDYEVTEKKDRDEKSGLITFKQTIRNHRDEDVAHCDIKVLFFKREGRDEHLRKGGNQSPPPPPSTA